MFSSSCLWLFRLALVLPLSVCVSPAGSKAGVASECLCVEVGHTVLLGYQATLLLWGTQTRPEGVLLPSAPLYRV